ncbi:hypothetical protein ATS71_15800 [Pseudoalteromonas sp. H71]|nr:hypothetical protein ATS71_15800 [Pseudoalteromonas sp. H71]
MSVKCAFFIIFSCVYNKRKFYAWLLLFFGGITLELDKVANEYKKLTNKIPKGMPIPSDIEAIFWMQQEFRVSLFAQTLGTPYPISSKRILNAIKEIE